MILFDVNDLTPSNEQYLTSVSPVNTVPAKHSALKLVLALSLIPTFNLAFAAPATPTTTTTPISSNTDVDNQPLPIDAMRRFVDVYEKVRQNYVEPVSDDVLFDNALSGLLNKLDPYSDYLDAKPTMPSSILPMARLDKQALASVPSTAQRPPIKPHPSAHKARRSGKSLQCLKALPPPKQAYRSAISC